MIYHHVLAAYDGSLVSEKALQEAIKLVEKTPGSRLSVIHVISRPILSFEGFGYVAPESYQEKMQEYENALLAQAKTLINSLPYSNVVVLHGDTATTILKYAHENKCSIIVMGSRGLGAIKEWVLGSVSHQVVQKAQIPVLIIK